MDDLNTKATTILAILKILFTSGDSTEDVTLAAERLAEATNTKASLVARWEELELTLSDASGTVTKSIPATPNGIMVKHARAGWKLIGQIGRKEVTLDQAAELIPKIYQIKGSSPWIMATASGAVGSALGVSLGLPVHLEPLAIVFISGFLGYWLRQVVGRFSPIVFLQQFSAGLLAGLIAGFAHRYLGLETPGRLLALSAVLVMLPGAHFISGFIDIWHLRISLGFSRILYALMIIVAISFGLLLGLELLSGNMPSSSPKIDLVPALYIACAGLVLTIANFPLFSQSIRARNGGLWIILLGTIAFVTKWAVINLLGLSFWTGAFTACFFLGLTLPFVCIFYSTPYAGSVFVTTAALAPGVYFIRMLDGAVEITQATATTVTFADAWPVMAGSVTAILTFMLMAVGIQFPLIGRKTFMTFRRGMGKTLVKPTDGK